MSARERILGRIIAARGATRSTSTIDDPLRARTRGPVPKADADLVGQFVDRATKLASDVVRVARLFDVPTAVGRYLSLHGLPHRAVCWSPLSSLAWADSGIEVEARVARGDDRVGITGAFAAVAETGTLMLLSGHDTPGTVSLLPETHIAVVDAALIVASMEDAWLRLRADVGAAPRAVSFVSGPSRTADVEQTVTLGAHGPRRVLIVVVG